MVNPRRKYLLALLTLAVVLPAWAFAEFPTAIPASRVIFNMSGEYDDFVSAAKASDGAVYLLGSRTLTKLSGGQAAWTVALSGSWGNASGLAIGSDGKVFVSFTDMGGKAALLMKYNAAGAVENSLTLPYSGAGYWPDGYGVAVDASNGYVYAAEAVYDQASGRYRAVVLAYNEALEPVGSQEYLPEDQQTCSDAAIPSGGVQVSASGDVYVGGYACKDDWTYRYFTVKYGPGLALLKNVSTKDADFDESPQLKAAADPAGGIVFIGNEKDAQGAAGFSVRRVDDSGVWSAPVYMTAFDIWSWPKAVAVDKDGSAYIAGNIKDSWAPAVTKLKKDGSYAWAPETLEKPEAGSLDAVFTDKDLNMYVAGYSGWNNDLSLDEFYLEAWSQGAEDKKYSLSASTGPYIFEVNTFSDPLVSVVKDDTGVAAPLRTVNFSVTAPAGATGWELEKTSETTNAQGLVEVRLKLGNIPAEYNVTATCPSCVPEAGSAAFTCCGKLKNDHFSQSAQAWSPNCYANNNCRVSPDATIGWRGCALTSLATLINYYNASVYSGIPRTNPGDLNAYLRGLPGSHGYTQENDVNFAIIGRYSGGRVSFVDRYDVGRYTEESLLDIADGLIRSGIPLIFRVEGHFVLVIGKCGDNFVIADPAGGRERLYNPDNPTDREFEGLRVFSVW
ncbi:MAG: hypothetical protein HY952_10690 [Elusimicrobia bacterium]|nr:hypothetical protein [Elusimicrobiota bacterium]